jgi:hypothetical protein
MDTQIVLIFCLCDYLLKGLHHVEDRQSQLSDAVVGWGATHLNFTHHFC